MDNDDKSFSELIQEAAARRQNKVVITNLQPTRERQRRHGVIVSSGVSSSTLPNEFSLNRTSEGNVRVRSILKPLAPSGSIMPAPANPSGLVRPKPPDIRKVISNRRSASIAKTVSFEVSSPRVSNNAGQSSGRAVVANRTSVSLNGNSNSAPSARWQLTSRKTGPVMKSAKHESDIDSNNRTKPSQIRTRTIPLPLSLPTSVDAAINKHSQSNVTAASSNVQESPPTSPQTEIVTTPLIRASDVTRQSSTSPAFISPTSIQQHPKSQCERTRLKCISVNTAVVPEVRNLWSSLNGELKVKLKSIQEEKKGKALQHNPNHQNSP